MQKNIANRVSTELKTEMLRFMEGEGLDESTAVRHILKIGSNKWKKRRAKKADLGVEPH